jgi:hypothetical protein
MGSSAEEGWWWWKEMRGAMNFGGEGGLIWGITIAGPDGKPTAGGNNKKSRMRTGF